MSTAPFVLLDLRIAEGDDGTAVRHVANRAAVGLGLGRSDATRLATAVSELGRLGARHAPTTVTVESVPVGSAAGRPGREGSRDRGHDDDRDDDPVDLQVRFGFGLTGWRTALDGTGLSAAVGRLVDEVEVTDAGVTLRARGARELSVLELTELRHRLLADRPGDLRAVLESQNAELLGALASLRDREVELVRLNGELEQTNRGVVALYAELELRASEIRQAQRGVFVELERALRPPPLLVSGVELDVRYLPSQVNSPTGGDLYDWAVLPDGCLHLAVVDVLGHGVTSTRDALRVTHTLRTLVQEGYPLDKVLERANTLLDLPGHPLYATALVARFDPQLGQLEVAGAGHPPALLLTADGSIRFLEAPGRPLGYPRAGSSGSVLVDLGPDDCVLLYTDGLVEVRQDIVEGLATLETAAIKAAALDLPQLLDTVLGACLRSDPLRDDTLLLGLRWQQADARGSRDDLGVSLPHSPEAPTMARQYLMERATGLSTAVLDDALVVLSEVVGNAVRHGRGPIVLRLGATEGGIRVEVRDAGELFVHDAAAVPPTGPSSGRGLFLVQALAARWGVTPVDGEPGGKTVWFEF